MFILNNNNYDLYLKQLYNYDKIIVNLKLKVLMLLMMHAFVMEKLSHSVLKMLLIFFKRIVICDCAIKHSVDVIIFFTQI